MLIIELEIPFKNIITITKKMESKSLLVNSTVTNAVCANLTFEEAVQFRDALNLPVLNCPISIRDPKTSKTLFLPGINSLTIKVYQLISKFGLDGSLIEASKNGSNEVVQILVEKGANLNATDQSGSTALMGASQNGHHKTVKILREAGAF